MTVHPECYADISLLCQDMNNSINAIIYALNIVTFDWTGMKVLWTWRFLANNIMMFAIIHDIWKEIQVGPDFCYCAFYNFSAGGNLKKSWGLHQALTFFYHLSSQQKSKRVINHFLEPYQLELNDL